MKLEDVPELEEGFDSRIRFPVEGDPPVALVSNEEFELDDDETEVCSHDLTTFTKLLSKADKLWLWKFLSFDWPLLIQIF